MCMIRLCTYLNMYIDDLNVYIIFVFICTYIYECIHTYVYVRVECIYTCEHSASIITCAYTYICA